MLKLIFLLQLSFAQIPGAFPEYEKDIQAAQAEVDKKEKPPQEVRKSFQDTVNKKTQEVSKYVRVKKDELFKLQQDKKKEFEAAAKKELAEFKKLNPEGDIKAFVREQGEKRQKFLDALKRDKKTIEQELNEKKATFDVYVKDAKSAFQTKWSEYSKAVRDFLKTKPADTDTEAQNEFKEIPKGQGTVLAPDKTK